jgi:Zn-dependent peptidase ImmA (M78 family)/transcriptional regulator with XRE-family HTH domain
MAFNQSILADKLIRYREQFKLSISELADATGINANEIKDFENGKKIPSGDQILIIADFYKCDYKFFISNEKLAPFEQTETLFRKYGDQFSTKDRWAVQEILFLAECESFLQNLLTPKSINNFNFTKTGTNFKNQGADCAKLLRKHIGYSFNQVPMDIYQDFRSIGVHIFRRKLENSNISGLYIKHPTSGSCILVNYNEDIYRQRFTAAHETGHAILDKEEDFVVSFAKWEKKDLVEIRANKFASNYLMPPEFLQSIPNASEWNENKIIIWANKLKVSVEALSYSLRSCNLIDAITFNSIKKCRVKKEDKVDAELSGGFSQREIERKSRLLEHGLSTSYVTRCFEAYHNNIISLSRMAEMFLTNEHDLSEIAQLYGQELRYGC